MENQNKKCEQLISIEECQNFIEKMDSSVFSIERFKKSRLNPNDLKEFMALLNKVECCLSKLDDNDLKKYSLHHSNPEIQRMAADILRPRNEKKSWLYKLGIIPRYTEITLFLISYIFFFLFIDSPSFRGDIFRTDGNVSLTIIAIVGMILSVYHAFSKRSMLKIEKYVILFFAVSINFFIGYYAGLYILKQSQGIWIIFPIFNIINALLLLFLFRAGVITETSILDNQAKYSEIILGVISVSIIFLISHYIFKNYWAITFSISLFYATNLNKIFNKYFLKGQQGKI